jgi:drug/metabolite transporter (DMT)-like permease
MIWGTTFVISDTALGSMSPAALTVARFVLALSVLAPVALRRGGVAVAIRSPPVALLGATGVAAYYGLQNLGLVTTGAGTAAVLQAGLPIETSVIAWLWLGERLTGGLLAGLALATISVDLWSEQGAGFHCGSVYSGHSIGWLPVRHRHGGAG